MKNELVETPQAEQSNMLAIIERAATDVAVDVVKMQALLDVQERIMVKQAEIEFNEAMARLELPEIKKLGKTHNSKYAKYEHIDREIRPLYTAEGFSMSFNSKLNDNVETYYGTLSHVGGHSRTAEMALPPDTSGSKNAIQAKGSTISYAKRYLLCMLLNIITVDEDDDGSSAFPITDEQFEQLQTLIDETGSDSKTFCEKIGLAGSLKEIQGSRFYICKSALQSRKLEQQKTGTTNDNS